MPYNLVAAKSTRLTITGGPFPFLEISMKSSYRQAVESVIDQEAKLAEVVKLHAEAADQEKQLAEALRFNQETLQRYEARVAELESQILSSAGQQSEPKV